MSNSNSIHVGRHHNPGQNPTAEIVIEKPNDQLNHEIATEFVKRSEKAVDSTTQLMQRTMDARAAMDVLCETWKADWLDFQNTSDSRLKEMRMTRMAMDSEMRQIMAGCREIRNFFLDKDYSVERERLKEFVDICERLQRLKESGFLDAVSDTMLRLAVK